MIKAGIDVGAQNVKVVLVNDGKVIARTMSQVGLETEPAVRKTLDEALQRAKVKQGDLKAIVVTGVGRKAVSFATAQVSEMAAAARGTNASLPSVRTVVDVGAEEGRAVKADGHGKVMDFAINEKCGAGAGAFTDSMSRALGVTLEEFGKLSLKSEKSIPMNAQCAVFAESEVVSLIHSGISKEDISRAVHDAMADRVASVVRMVGLEKDIALVGGLALNPGFIQSFKRSLETDVLVPEEPLYVGALGAALSA